ncbi:hypothetical protein GCM10009584_01090 [Ornithinimicrobium humiphilum]|uniref:hypothetical protein n=1 Tax=Ornithinimicrobium humiphilum TaxID=125288 RepID=UPI00114E7ED7|nr:hypothetical protein [Ornithinimicrobium humiphilum]
MLAKLRVEEAADRCPEEAVHDLLGPHHPAVGRREAGAGRQLGDDRGPGQVDEDLGDAVERDARDEQRQREVVGRDRPGQAREQQDPEARPGELHVTAVEPVHDHAAEVDPEGPSERLDRGGVGGSETRSTSEMTQEEAADLARALAKVLARHTDAAKERREAERSGEAPAEAGPTRRLRVYLDVFPLVDDD